MKTETIEGTASTLHDNGPVSERFAKGAIQEDSILALVGKPLTVTGKDGRKHRAGTIKSAHIDRNGIHVTATVENESLKRYVRVNQKGTIGG